MLSTKFWLLSSVFTLSLGFVFYYGHLNEQEMEHADFASILLRNKKSTRPLELHDATKKIEKPKSESQVVMNDPALSQAWGLKKSDAIPVIDFLRSKGYAVPFMEYSVDDLVSFGWVQLL